MQTRGSTALQLLMNFRFSTDRSPLSRAILHDEKLFGQNTNSFVPERFLKDGVRDPTAAFGFGRRYVRLSFGRFHLWVTLPAGYVRVNIWHRAHSSSRVAEYCRFSRFAGVWTRTAMKYR